MLLALLTAVASFTDGTPDQVLMKGATVTWRGEIVQYDDSVLKMKIGNEGTIKEFAVANIAKVTTQVEPNDVAGDESLAKGDYAGAINLYRAAVRNETREWAVGRTRCKMLKALRAVGDIQGMAETFLQVVPNRTDAEIVAYGPFRWIPGQELPDSQRALAKVWLSTNRESLGKLLAANWLLDSPDKADALAVLKDTLRTDPDDRVRPLAKALLLRTKLQDGESPNSKDVAELRRDVESLPNAIRAGPQYVLAMASERTGTPAEAALAYLMIPYVLGGPPEVQAQAMLSAAKATDRGGMHADARKIYRELADRYPDLKAGKEAKAKLGK